jgi:hypothetical protein
MIKAAVILIGAMGAAKASSLATESCAGVVRAARAAVKEVEERDKLNAMYNMLETDAGKYTDKAWEAWRSTVETASRGKPDCDSAIATIKSDFSAYIETRAFEIQVYSLNLGINAAVGNVATPYAEISHLFDKYQLLKGKGGDERLGIPIEILLEFFRRVDPSADEALTYQFVLENKLKALESSVAHSSKVSSVNDQCGAFEKLRTTICSGVVGPVLAACENAHLSQSRICDQARMSALRKEEDARIERELQGECAAFEARARTSLPEQEVDLRSSSAAILAKLKAFELSTGRSIYSLQAKVKTAFDNFLVRKQELSNCDSVVRSIQAQVESMKQSVSSAGIYGVFYDKTQLMEMWDKFLLQSKRSRTDCDSDPAVLDVIAAQVKWIQAH